MTEISNWVNIVFFGIAFLFIMNMFSQERIIERRPKRKFTMEHCPIEEAKIREENNTGENYKEESQRIKELEKEVANYKERLQEYKSQIEVWKLILEKNSVNKIQT